MLFRSGIDPFGNGRVKAMQTIEQKNLIRFELHRLAGHSPAFFETINWFIDGLPFEQADRVGPGRGRIERRVAFPWHLGSRGLAPGRTLGGRQPPCLRIELIPS